MTVLSLTSHTSQFSGMEKVASVLKSSYLLSKQLKSYNQNTKYASTKFFQEDSVLS